MSLRDAVMAGPPGIGKVVSDPEVFPNRYDVDRHTGFFLAKGMIEMPGATGRAATPAAHH
ncbi:hypothetical protein Raf01_05660 [Rugosimonospora africana]|uniref:Uncharacterized protein n=1 Tax=Rugosimonospora africana TaxID=556532 RepID=A0A8J3QM32_9ACTN|nr:hypothetical protein Raf01_05660 [Rugosimonospora africana]